MVNHIKKIFVVDDDISIGDILSMMLEMEGYDVASFNCGRDGVGRARQVRPDLVLLDYFLPGENAEDIIKKLRGAVGENLPILLMSASSQAAQISKKLGVNEFIPKPFQREILLEAIERNLN